MWVARDKDGTLKCFSKRPNRLGVSWCVDDNVCGYSMLIDSNLFHDLKWKDEPLEVCLCINNEKYHTVKIEELNRLYNTDWSYQDMKETLETYFDMVDNYRKLPWYKRIFTNI